MVMKLKKAQVVSLVFVAVVLVFGFKMTYAENDSTQSTPFTTDQMEGQNSEQEQQPVPSVADYKMCMKNTMLNRDNMMVSGWSIFSNAMTEAYTAKREATANAFTNASSRDEMQKVMIDGEKAFAQASSKAQKAWKEAQRKVFRQFQEDKKKCSPKKTSFFNFNNKESVGEDGMIKGIQQKSDGVMMEKPSFSDSVNENMMKKPEENRMIPRQEDGKPIEFKQ